MKAIVQYNIEVNYVFAKLIPDRRGTLIRHRKKLGNNGIAVGGEFLNADDFRSMSTANRSFKLEFSYDNLLPTQ